VAARISRSALKPQHLRASLKGAHIFALAFDLPILGWERKVMDSGYYAVLTGLIARIDALEVAANNLANVGTAGYKAQREFYRSLTANMNGIRLSALNQVVNDYGVLGGAVTDRQSGALQRTDNELDVALDGPGFFAIQTKAGERYTRNGNFRVDPQGRLQTAAGDMVVGDQGPIEIPSGTVVIGSDGTISQKGAIIARLKVVDFRAGTNVTPEGQSLYAAPSGTATVATEYRVRQGMLEASNLSAISATVDLITLQRHTELLQRALSIINTDFNKLATDELPKVQF
jgi:flagellar basal-body rod protein FlgF